MKVRVAAVNPEAESFLPPSKPDGSGIGVNYVDEYIKVLNTTLDDGRDVACKRLGLQLTLTVGGSKGQSIMRRIDHGPDPKDILMEALSAAAIEAGASISVEEGAIFLDIED